MGDSENVLYLEADVEIHEETKALREKASSAIKLPDVKLKQPDLLYFSAIFVSSGENLNHAYFLPSELIQAEGSIINKALDVEHKEEEIVGHIYERAFVDSNGEVLDLKELASNEEIDLMDVHVAIAGILYKSRFPNLAKEVEERKWKVSMEAYFTDFDVKVGDLIISKDEAESLGLASNDLSTFGRMAKVIKDKKEIAKGTITRVLRGIVLSGCEFVKHAANPPSIVLETAHSSRNESNQCSEIIINYDEANNETQDVSEENNNLTSLDEEPSAVFEDKDVEESKNSDSDVEELGGNSGAIENDDTVGICVSFKRWVYEGSVKGPDTKVLHENWCTLYDRECTSFSRDTTDPDCLRNRIESTVNAMAARMLEKRRSEDNRRERMSVLKTVLSSAEKYLNKED
jgi:hypothetical protein